MARSDKIKQLPRLHWAEITNSDAADARKLPQEWDDWTGSASAKYDSYQGNTGYTSLMSAWCGAALDSTRSILTIPRGGGHQDYFGTERIQFDLTGADGYAWTREEDPHPSPAMNVANCGNGTPTARHTYNGIAYHAARDSIYICGGSVANSGNFINDLWELSAAGVWTQRASVTGLTGFLENHLVYRSTSGALLFFSPTQPIVRSYAPGTNTWTTLATTGTDVHAQAAPCYCAALDEVWWVNPSGVFNVFNCSTNAWSAPAVTGTSPAAGSQGAFGGFTYDTLNERGLYWRGGTTIYAINRKRRWSAHTVKTTNLKNPGVVGGGSNPACFGRFRYVPNYDVVVWVAATGTNVFVARV